MLIIKVNTTRYDFITNKKTGIFRVIIPPDIIPIELKDIIIKQANDLKDLENKLLSENETSQNISKKKKDLKKTHKKLFSFFINLEGNLNLLAFYMGDNKLPLLESNFQINETNELFSNISDYFNLPKVSIKPIVSKGKSEKLKEDTLRILDEKHKEVEFYKGVCDKLMRLMTINQIDFKDYEDIDNQNLNYNKYIKLNDKEKRFFIEKDTENQDDNNFLDYALDILKKRAEG